MNQLQKVKSNIDARTVTSVVVGLGFFGALMYGASQIKALRKVVTIAKGGK